VLGFFSPLSIFFEKTQKSLHFILLNRKRLQVPVQLPTGGTHTHTRVGILTIGEVVPQTTERNNKRSRLVQPPTMNCEAAKLRASRPRHSRCQVPPKKTTSPGCPCRRTLHPCCLGESAGEWQDPSGTSEAIVLEASAQAYITPWTPTLYAAAHITASHCQQASPERPGRPPSPAATSGTPRAT